MKRFLVKMVSASLLVAVLAACSDGGDSGGGDGGNAKAEKLTFWLSGDANQGGGYAAMAKQYEAETGTKVEITDVPYDDFMIKLRNAAQANDLPDIGRVPSIDQLWIEDLVDLSSIAEERGIMPSLLASDDEGQMLQLPSDLTAVGLFVNKSLFDKAGVAYPTTEEDRWTWTEFQEAVAKVQAATGARYGMVMDRSSHRLRSFLYQWGADGFPRGEDGKYHANKETKTALQAFADLNNDTFIPKSVWVAEDDPNAMFKSGQVVAYYSGVWQVADFQENIKDFEWASALMPKQPKVATNLGTNLMVAFDSNGQGEAAKAFLDWLYQKENYTKLSEISGFLPVIPGLEVTYSGSQQSYDLYNHEIEMSDPLSGYQITSGLADIYAGRQLEGDPIREETIKLVAGEQDVDAAVQAIIDRMNEDLGG